jgi:hypothetical protein
MSHTAFEEGLGYEGKVTLTLKSNNRILKSKTYKNNGTAILFKFLGYCLINAFEDAKALLPSKILLLYNHGNNPIDASPTDVEVRSDWRGWAHAPTIISDSASAQVKVVYSFEVPRAAIADGPFNQVALYGSGEEENSASITEFSAYYYLTDDFGAFEPIYKSDWSASTVLLIEWELSLSNKNVETNH